LGFKELWLPLLFVFLGMAIIIPSIPGEGNTGLIALGMSLAFVGAAVAKRRMGAKTRN
jgi:hypothetical protein